MIAPAERVDALPTVARLYYGGSSNRRYKRASVKAGPGEPLCFRSVAEYAIKRARLEERAAVAELIEKADDLATAVSNLIAAREIDPGYGQYVTDLTDALARVGGDV